MYTDNTIYYPIGLTVETDRHCPQSLLLLLPQEGLSVALALVVAESLLCSLGLRISPRGCQCQSMPMTSAQ